MLQKKKKKPCKLCNGTGYVTMGGQVGACQECRGVGEKRKRTVDELRTMKNQEDTKAKTTQVYVLRAAVAAKMSRRKI